MDETNPITQWLADNERTQAWLCRHTGWSTGFMSLLLRGRRPMTAKVLLPVLRACPGLDALATLEWYERNRKAGPS